jgi:hypothetical protein
MTFVLFALPSIGAQPQKYYSLEFLLPPTVNGQDNPAYDPGTGQLLPPVVVTVSIKNESPPSVGNSNISSFKFAVSGLTILSASCPGAMCSVDPATNTVYVTNISPPVKATKVFTVTLQVSSCVVVGEAAIPPASVMVYTGSQLSGDLFAAYSGDATFPLQLTLADPSTLQPTGISCGDIDCGETFTVANSQCNVPSDPNNPKCVTIVRGLDKNGLCAVTVDYSATNNLYTSDKQLHLTWSTDPSAAFAFKANVVSVGSWKVAWLPDPGLPVFITAPYCNDRAINPPADLPLPTAYGILTVNVNDTSTLLHYDLSPGVTPPAVGFAIGIGSERMLVTGVGPNTLTVQRGDGFTTAAPHLAGSYLMYTPLPKLVVDYLGAPYAFTPAQTAAGYMIGLQAQVCLASVPLDNGDGTWSAWIIAIGDPWLSGK